MEAIFTNVAAARRDLALAVEQLMHRSPARAADVPAVLCCHRVERILGAMELLARSGYSTETIALGRCLLDATFSAALALDDNEQVRAERLERFVQAAVEYQLVQMNRLETSRHPWVQDIFNRNKASMLAQRATLTAELQRIGGVAPTKKRMDHWFGDRRAVACAAGLEQVYDTFYQSWNDEAHMGAFSMELMLKEGCTPDHLALDDAGQRLEAEHALEICAFLAAALAKQCEALAVK